MAEMRRRNGKWVVTIRNSNFVGTGKKSKSKTFDSKLDAQIWLSKIENGLDPTENLDIMFSERKFSEAINLYLQKVTPMKKGGYNEVYIGKRLLKEDWVKLPVSQLTIGHLTDFRDKRLSTIRPSTFRREWVLVRSIAKFGKANGIHMNMSLFNHVHTPRFEERPIERITPEMEEKLLLCAKSAGKRLAYLPFFINLALATAMRRGELCSLEWDHVDLKGKRIFVLSTKTKSGKGRTIPITTRAADALDGLAKIRRVDRKTKELHKYVIPATGNAVRLAFGRIRKLAGLEHIRIHDLRHESISRFWELGLTIPEIMQISGHSDLETLQRYSHASPTTLIEKLGEGI